MGDLPELLALLASGDENQAQAASHSLASLGGAAIPHLADLLRHPPADTRWWAVRTLAAIPDPRVAGILTPILEDPDPAVRQCAALALREHPDPANTAALIQALEDENRLFARLAGDALAAIGEPAVPKLLACLKTGSDRARLEAIRSLASIADPRTVSELFDILQEGDTPLMEYWADLALERMGIGMRFFKR